MHRHANIRHVCETYGAQVLGITPDDIDASRWRRCSSPTASATRCSSRSRSGRRPCSSRGGRPRTSYASGSTQTRPTLFFGVPTFYAALAASDLPDDAFASVRLCASAGEPLPAPLQRRFTDRFGVEILDGIGSTEALHIFLSNRPGDIRPGTTGRPVPGYDVELRDDDGRARRRRRAGRAVRARRVDRARLLAPHRRHPAGVPGRVAGHRRHLRPRRATATTPAWAATATCSRPAASGSRPPRWRAGCSEHPAVARGGRRRRGRRRRPRQAGRRRGRRREAGITEEELVALVPRRAWRTSRRPGRSSSSTTCRRPRPASCSASRSATSSPSDPRRRARARPPPRRHS